MGNLIEQYFNQNNYAVVGASRRKDKYGYKVMRDLIARGKNVFPVHPAVNDIDGIKCYPNLDAIPEKIDAVHFIVPPAATEEVAEIAIKLGIKWAWMQPGAESPVAIKRLEESGAKVLHNTCILLQP